MSLTSLPSSELAVPTLHRDELDFAVFLLIIIVLNIYHLGELTYYLPPFVLHDSIWTTLMSLSQTFSDVLYRTHILI